MVISLIDWKRFHHKKMMEGKQPRKKRTIRVEDNLVPAVERLMELNHAQVERLKEKSKKLTDLDSILRVGKNVAELKELNVSIQSKIETVKELLDMFQKVRCDTETLIDKEVDNGSVDSSNEEPINGDNGPQSHGDASSEEELPEHLRDIEEPAPAPMIPFSNGKSFTTSTPKFIRGQNDVRGPDKAWTKRNFPLSSAARIAPPSLKLLPNLAPLTSRPPTARLPSEISAIQAAKSLETLMVPSTSRPTSTETSPSQSAAVENPLNEPSRTELIIVTYDNPSRKDIECPYCCAAFMSRQTLVSHVRDKHKKYYRLFEKVGTLYKSRTQLLQPSMGRPSSEAKRAKECTMCRYSFARDKLLDHIKTSHIFEINNFIWIMNFQDVSNCWREFFMSIQGTDIEGEKEKSAAFKKSNLKVAEPVTKEPYDRLRTLSGVAIKRTRTEGLSPPRKSKVARPNSTNERSKSRGTTSSIQGAKENLPRNPPKLQSIKSGAKTPVRGRPKTAIAKSKTDPKEVEAQLFEFDIQINHVDVIDLNKEPKQGNFFGPMSKRVAYKCSKCGNAYVKAIELAIHRIKFCKFRKPNPFKSPSLKTDVDKDSPGPSTSNKDINHGSGSGSNSGDKDGSGSSSMSKNPGPSNQDQDGYQEMDKSRSDSESSDPGEEIVSRKRVEKEAEDSFVCPDSTSDAILATNNDDNNVADSEPQSDNQSDDEDSAMNDDYDDQSSGDESEIIPDHIMTRKDVLKRDDVEDYDKLLVECITRDSTVKVPIVTVEVEELHEDRYKMIKKIRRSRLFKRDYSLAKSQLNTSSTTSSPVRQPPTSARKTRSPSLPLTPRMAITPTRLTIHPMFQAMPRDPRLAARNLTSDLENATVQDSAIPVGSEVDI